MPHRLIARLKTLVSLEIQVQFPDLPLNDPRAGLPEDIASVVDLIEYDAKVVFGRNIKPTPRQLALMQSNGFPVIAETQDSIGWKRGRIQTIKGDIIY